MKIYLISQTENDKFDTFDSAVVCAPDAETARSLHPGTGEPMTNGQWKIMCSGWCSSVDQVTARYLGNAQEGTEQGVVLASYNAG